MNTRKTVIFIIDNKKQLFSQFNENTEIGILKTFIRDNTKFDFFSLLYNGVDIKNDSLKLKKLCGDNLSSPKMIFQVISRKEEENYNEILNQLRNENEVLKNENLALKKKCKIYEENLNKEKRIAEYKISEVNNRIIILEKEIEDKNKLIKQKDKIIEKLYNLNKNKISSKKTNNQLSKSKSAIISRSKNKNTPNISISQMNTKTPLTNREKLKKVNKNSLENSPWIFVIPFLILEEELQLSLVNRKIGICVLRNWQARIFTKSNHLNRRRHYSICLYQETYKDNSFHLSNNSISSIKTLNEPSYLKIFSKFNYISYFSNPKLLLIYRLFFQFCFPREVPSFDEDETFISFFVNLIKNNTITQGLGDYCKQLIGNFVFSGENLEKLSNILKQYEVNEIKCEEFEKEDKTSGLISYIVKDALINCGLQKEKRPNDEILKQRSLIVEENKQMIEIKQKYTNVQEKIEDIIETYYK